MQPNAQAPGEGNPRTLEDSLHAWDIISDVSDDVGKYVVERKVEKAREKLNTLRNQRRSLETTASFSPTEQDCVAEIVGDIQKVRQMRRTLAELKQARELFKQEIEDSIRKTTAEGSEEKPPTTETIANGTRNQHSPSDKEETTQKMSKVARTA